MSTRKQKVTLFSVFFTFFVDNLCWAIVFPIFAPYFLDPDNVLFSVEVSTATRTTILGFFLMAFSLGQFLGAPIMGEYADKHGPKKALIIGVFFTLVGLALSAWSMMIGNLFLLFIGRLITGVSASTTAICLSCIGKFSDNEAAKGRNFSYLSMIAGLSFLMGAFAGGKLSDKTVSSYFSPYFPLWIAAVLTFVNLIFVWFGFREKSVRHPWTKFDFFAAFRNIGMAIRAEKIKKMYIVYFLFLFAWTILFQYVPVLTVEKFEFTNSNIGDLALFMGICWAIGSGYLNVQLTRRYPPQRILEICLIGFTLLCGLVIFPKHIYGVLAIFGVCVILGGMAWPICTGFISKEAPDSMQGKVFGVSQSVQSFAMTVSPVVGGLAFHASFGLPFLLAAGVGLLASITYYFTLKRR